MANQSNMILHPEVHRIQPICSTASRRRPIQKDNKPAKQSLVPYKIYTALLRKLPGWRTPPYKKKICKGFLLWLMALFWVWIYCTKGVTKMAKTLKQQIAELEKQSVQDFDIEDAERDVFDHSEGEEESEDEGLKTEHYVSVGKSKLRDQGIHLRDERYKGSVTSRKALMEESEGESDSDVSGEEGDESLDDESVDGSEQEQVTGSEEEDSEEEQEESDDNESQDDSSVVDSEEEGSSITDSDASDSEPSHDSKRDKLKLLMSQERKVILSRLSTSTQTDALKGYAVISQQKQFDSIIDSRIKLQKALQNSNALPLNNETFEEFQEDESEELQKSAIQSIIKLLNGVISLRTKIFNKDKLTKDPLSFTKKRTFADLVTETQQLDTVLKKNRDQVLTKWSHKVQSASGAQALNASKFKTLNQGANQQVENNLMDIDRLVKRTRLNRRDVVPMGRVEEDESNSDDEEQTKTLDRSLKEDADVFDDEDFYRVLLNDLVNKKLSDNAPSGGLVITKTKVKKNIDTKASKGRKLNYTVQEKIQNYEVPKGSFKWDDLQIDEFFAGLLGQRVDFAEDSDDEDLEEEMDMVKEDGLKLFG